jgi:hypothetical protein
MTRELETVIERVIVPALLDRWMAERSSEVAEQDRPSPSNVESTA